MSSHFQRSVTPPDPEAWEAERAFIAERVKIPVIGGQRGWSREELYHERLLLSEECTRR